MRAPHTALVGRVDQLSVQIELAIADGDPADQNRLDVQFLAHLLRIDFLPTVVERRRAGDDSDVRKT